MRDEDFRQAASDTFQLLARRIHENAKAKGWYPPEGRNEGEMIALMHSELSEALEGLREGNPPDDKISAYSSVEAEMADTVIRILDYCYMKGFDLGSCVVAKMVFNESRTHKHGGKKF